MLSGCGICLIKVNNVFYKFLRKSLGFGYDTIGFYYTVSSGNNRKTQYITLMDIWTFSRPMIKNTFLWSDLLKYSGCLELIDIFTISDIREEKLKNILINNINYSSEDFVLPENFLTDNAVGVANKILSEILFPSATIQDLKNITDSYRLNFTSNEHCEIDQNFLLEIIKHNQKYFGVLQNNFINEIIQNEKTFLGMKNELKIILQSMIKNNKIKAETLENLGIKCPKQDKFITIEYNGLDIDPDFRDPIEDLYSQTTDLIAQINNKKDVKFDVKRLIKNVNGLSKNKKLSQENFAVSGIFYSRDEDKILAEIQDTTVYIPLENYNLSKLNKEQLTSLLLFIQNNPLAEKLISDIKLLI